MHRPHRRNACNGILQRALYKTFVKFENDSDSCVAILTGSNGVFCAGADLSMVASSTNVSTNTNNTNTNTSNTESQMKFDYKLSNIDNLKYKNETPNIQSYTESMGPMGISRLLLTKPTICAVQGYCVAGGLELALWCDMRIGNLTSKFGVFCRRFGVPLIDGGTLRLPKIIGFGNAMDMILTGKEVDCNQALRIGLISRLIKSTDEKELIDEAINIGKLICSFPQECMKLDRMNAYKGLQGSDYLHSLENEIKRAINSKAMKDMAQGASNFVKGQGRHGSKL